MNEKLSQALDHISDSHIADAATRKRRRRLWLGAIAAVLALALLLRGPALPVSVYATTVSKASESRALERTDDNFDQWYNEKTSLRSNAVSAVNAMLPFFRDSSAQSLSGSGGENRVWSPVNAFIALSMLAEITENDSRQQILTALNAANTDVLRQRVNAIWENVYQDDGHEISVLANSLWLNQELTYDQSVLDDLAYYHYADVYRTDFSSAKSGKALRTWLNNNTGNLLKSYTASSDLDPNTILTLASTVYFQGKWYHEFSASQNTQDVFHAPDGDITCTYMNRKEMQTDYFWGEDYGAVSLSLKNGSSMWLILPDEDKTAEDVLASGEYLEQITRVDEANENSKYMKVNLSMPKFDVSSGGDASDVFRSLGITDVFDLNRSDFSGITGDSPIFLTSVNQAARVMVDEQGVKAASYLEFPGAGAAAPPEEIIDFVLDRPFLFVIANSAGIPLFVGLVNNP